MGQTYYGAQLRKLCELLEGDREGLEIVMVVVAFSGLVSLCPRGSPCETAIDAQSRNRRLY